MIYVRVGAIDWDELGKTFDWAIWENILLSLCADCLVAG